MARRLIGWQGSSGGVWPGGSAFCVGTMAIIAGPASLLSPLRHSLPSVYRWPQHCHLSGVAILLSSYYEVINQVVMTPSAVLLATYQNPAIP